MALGAIVAAELYGTPIPVVVLDAEGYAAIADGVEVEVNAGQDLATVGLGNSPR